MQHHALNADKLMGSNKGGRGQTITPKEHTRKIHLDTAKEIPVRSSLPAFRE
jgi:hypothetical protein